jgi:amphi-Trp domain-containing protein
VWLIATSSVLTPFAFYRIIRTSPRNSSAFVTGNTKEREHYEQRNCTVSERRDDEHPGCLWLPHKLADKLARRQVIFRRGTKELVVSMPGGVILELKVEEELKKEKTQQSLEVEVSWNRAMTLGNRSCWVDPH